ncbi:MAG: hypothetical protein E4H03_04340 [Myxococcales bacterium]|jgi:hypothetical protein|nr:MAG: hypothetical protein E4H03_04340 [Myxococcales bacterium]
MSRARAGWLLWAAALLLIPLPYFLIAEGSVPVVRFAMLGGIAALYAGFVDGSGVAWTMTIVLLLHVIVWALSLGVVAALGAVLIPARSRRWWVTALIVVGFVFALVFDVYRTPFDDVRLQSNWAGLFQ